MPRPKKAGAPEPKTRSRNGCWPCKARKIKCGEEKPKCQNCERQGETCDYSIRLNWEGRTKRKGGETGSQTSTFVFHQNVTSPSGDSDLNSPGLSRTPQFITSPTVAGSPEGHGSPRSHRVRGRIHTQPDRTGLHSPSTDALTENALLPTKSTAAPPSTSAVNPTLARIRHSDTADQYEPMILVGNRTGQGPRDHFSAVQLSRMRDQRHSVSYPSPSDSNLESPPNFLNAMTFPAGSHPSLPDPQMPPPFQNSLSPWSHPSNLRKIHEEGPFHAQHRSKKMRLSPSIDPIDGGPRHQVSPHGIYNTGGLTKSLAPHTSPHAMQPVYHSSFNGNTGIPLTPAASSVASDDNYVRSFPKPSSQVFQDSPDLRRLSVKSLLSDDSPADSGTESAMPASPYITSSVSTPVANYGVDRGFPDLDLPNNNDSIALNGSTPSLSTVGLHNSEQNDHNGDSDLPAEFGFGLHGTNAAHEHGGYYAKPVIVTIPRSLGPLPSALLEKPMNMLYFHHFLNHTARILVPHDCSENPFKSILPQMALKDNNLLHLLLAYSASHRARLLKQPEPANRIALWVQDVFGTLRRALNDPTGQISNVNLATAIMLASLEIISPNTFDVPVPWQNHLNVARRMILARGGAQSVHRKDKVSYFLSRWFAYLDVLGSLSGGKNDQPLFSGDYWVADESDGDHDFQIDCLLGFTSRCVSILAKIAELARLCDNERIDSNGNIRESWKPSDQTVEAASKLKYDLQEARMHRYKGCPHRPRKNATEDGWDLLEMVATNEAFHWAGLIHLNRRVLGKTSLDVEVQIAVGEIEGALYKVRKGGTAEACLLFPMFTAGCDARRQDQRDRIMERLKSVEGSGMTQVHKARTLIEKVWETGRPWETLVTGEFFG